MPECVECGAEVSLHEDLEVGEIVDCATCGAELEVIGVDPVEARLRARARGRLGRVSRSWATLAVLR